MPFRPPGGHKPPTGLLSRLRAAFRDRFVVSSEYDSYMPPTPSSTAEGAQQTEAVYRYPSPASQPPAEIPNSYPETVYDTAFYKRSAIKLTPPDRADPEQFRRFAQPGQYPGDYPRHTPKPWWYYDEQALAGMRRMYCESGGLVAAGAWRKKPESEFIRVSEEQRDEGHSPIYG